MRQVRDTLIWLAMILVVVGVVYVMPRLANYVAAATGSEQGPACVASPEITIPHYQQFAHHHH
jgi:hypothetical protein